MTFTPESILLIGGILLFVSILVSKTGYRFGVPTLLLFLIVGMFFGSDGLGLEFHDADEAQFIGMISLSIILFTGGMDTNFKEIRPVLGPGILLSTAGVALTTLFTGLFIHFVLNFFSKGNIEHSFAISMLTAATMSSTDSASVFNILRTQRMNLKHNLRPMLELESGSNDPMAYMLTIVLIQLIQSSGMSGWEIGGMLLIQFVMGGFIGFTLGQLTVRLINRIRLANSSLYTILLLSSIFLIFTLTTFAKGNGYLAVYIAGMVVGNSRIVNKREISTFLDGMTWLFQIIMFLTLGLLVNPHEMLDIAIPAILIGVFMMIFARPLSVFISLLPFKQITFRSRVFVSWVGLRGAVPIIFATYPLVAEIQGARIIFNIVFFITILSLVIQGSSISFLARKLHLDEPLKEEHNHYGIEIPEEVGTQLKAIVLTEEMLIHGNNLKDMKLPNGMLVMLIKRQDEFIVPNGTLELNVDDELLVISK